MVADVHGAARLGQHRQVQPHDGAVRRLLRVAVPAHASAAPVVSEPAPVEARVAVMVWVRYWVMVE